MEDHCTKRPTKSVVKKRASGISVYLNEEIGDARLRALELKKHLDAAVSLIEKSDQRDHFFEVAGHLIHEIPQSMMKLEKALNSAAMAIARWDYEELKDEIRPEKVELLESALEDTRVRRVQRKEDKEASESPMKVSDVVARLNRLASKVEASGQVDTQELSNLIAYLETGSRRKSASTNELGKVFRSMSASLKGKGSKDRPTPLAMAAGLRRVLADTMEIKAPKPRAVKTASGTEINVHEVMAGLKQAAENYFDCRGYNKNLQLALQDAVNGHAATLGPLAGYPAALVRKASVLKESMEQLDAYMSGAATACQSFAQDLADPGSAHNKLAIDMGMPGMEPDMEAPFNAPAIFESIKNHSIVAWRKSNAGQFKIALQELGWSVSEMSRLLNGMNMTMAAEKGEVFSRLLLRAKNQLTHDMVDELKMARFEQGKPADPTKEMSEEDAEQWDKKNDEHKDNFKAAKFEEGQDADPTDDMSEEDQDEWKANTEKFKDKFKDKEAAARRRLADENPFMVKDKDEDKGGVDEKDPKDTHSKNERDYKEAADENPFVHDKDEDKDGVNEKDPKDTHSKNERDYKEAADENPFMVKDKDEDKGGVDEKDPKDTHGKDERDYKKASRNSWKV